MTIPPSKLPSWCRPSGIPRWRYRVRETIVESIQPTRFSYSVHAPSGLILATYWKHGALEIHSGYCFDGATCAPDFPALLRACVFHDLLCQCAYHPDWPISRRLADRIFLHIGRRDAPLLTAIYYAGIRAGGLVHRSIFPPPPSEGVIVTRFH